MVLRQLYTYSAMDVKRYISGYELKNKKIVGINGCSNLTNFYDDNIASHEFKRYHNHVKYAVPTSIVIEKVNDTFVEYFSKRVVIDLNNGEYANGIVIDKDDFLKSIKPIKEFELNEILLKYSDESLKLRFHRFVEQAQNTYIEHEEKEEKKKLQATKEAGWALVKR